ncbi:MAG: MOSC domain-containing protein [Steroidobacteraceae bacterium]
MMDARYRSFGLLDMVSVEELNIYPLKSARGIAKSAVRLAATGFEWDRNWMITDAAGGFLTQRTDPNLARIETSLTATGLTLRAPGLPALELPFTFQGEAMSVQVWKDRCEGLDQGRAASEWASAVLEKPVRLVRVPSMPKRAADPAYAGPQLVPVSFADGFPILVCNRASLDDLNARMPEPIPIGRFRPNIVLSGLEPFAEDRIASVRIGAVTLKLVKPCTRCVITSTDQSTGERSTNPLPYLRAFRFDRKLLGVTFGENAVVVDGVGATIDQGAECVVTLDENPGGDARSD